jgi:hypothetical protein
MFEPCLMAGNSNFKRLLTFVSIGNTLSVRLTTIPDNQWDVHASPLPAYRAITYPRIMSPGLLNKLTNAGTKFPIQLPKHSRFA